MVACSNVLHLGFYADRTESFFQLDGMGSIMSKTYAIFDSSGALVTTMIDGVHNIPDGAVETSSALHKKIINETDGIWTLHDDGSITKEPIPEVGRDYAGVIAAERFKYETSGVTVDGARFETGRDSQALISGAAISAMLDQNYECTWKSVDGPVRLNSTQIIGVATAVRVHVQACFDREFELLAAVDSGEFSEDMLADGWPS